ncbi:MAG TPA: ferredoxin [Verrucomicrobiae bacterium]|nr:ferredoxin [Verrucomicrobiae bacterium]
MSEEATPHSVFVDREMCQTAAICLAYHMYELDDEGKAVLLTNNGQNSDDETNPLRDMEGEVAISDLVNPDGRTPEEMQRLVLESAKICPFNAIIVKDAEGNQIWPL